MVQLFRLLELVGTSIATFTVKHFLMEQEKTLKELKAQMKRADLVIDDKCVLLHKYLQLLYQSQRMKPLWGSASE